MFTLIGQQYAPTGNQFNRIECPVEIAKTAMLSRNTAAFVCHVSFKTQWHYPSCCACMLGVIGIHGPLPAYLLHERLQIRHVSQRLVAQAQTVDKVCPGFSAQKVAMLWHMDGWCLLLLLQFIIQ